MNSTAMIRGAGEYFQFPLQLKSEQTINDSMERSRRPRTIRDLIEEKREQLRESMSRLQQIRDNASPLRLRQRDPEFEVTEICGTILRRLGQTNSQESPKRPLQPEQPSGKEECQG